MDKVKVTPEMRDRILEAIEQTDFEAVPTKTSWTKRYQIVLPFAVCLLLCVISIFSLNQPSAPNNPPLVQNGFNCESYASIDALSSALQFKVKEVTWLPFNVSQTDYTAYNDELAEIIYRNAHNLLTFRMAKGTDDISGDYTTYETTKTFTVENQMITLRGNKDQFSLATWHDQTFTYSILLETPLSETEFTKLIQSIK